MIEPKVASWKRDRVGELVAILTSDGVLGIVDIGGAVSYTHLRAHET